MNNVADISDLPFKLAKLDIAVKIAGRPMNEVDVKYLKTESNILAQIMPRSVGIIIKTTESDGKVNEYFIPYSKVRSLEF